MIVLWMKIKNFILRLLHSIFCNNKTESMKVYKNIDVVQINVKAGVREYFLPKNVDWANRVIDKIVVYYASNALEVSPVDRYSTIVGVDIAKDLYVDLYTEDGREITHAISAQNLFYTNNNIIEVDSKISLQLSRLFFAQASPENGCLLLYVFYKSINIENFELPRKSVTVHFELGAQQEIALSDVIDTYIHANRHKVKGIYYWGSILDSAVFMTLRDHNYNTICKHLPLTMCKPPMGKDYYGFGSETIAETLQINPLFLDNEDIDFANSTIINTWYAGLEYGARDVKLTFLY